MIEIKRDCYILEGVVCKGDISDGRWSVAGRYTHTGEKPGSSRRGMPAAKLTSRGSRLVNHREPAPRVELGRRLADATCP